ncbi:hypothetical protein ATJ88_2881 [Isoptericola jiangsuensis]|uniref:Uncharacterized protein n=1 Tax=Isoptericola jiangsuensis TaxID=548579 RepID=A0A2A9EZI2_9MICO|nr:hypothetical protein [Isoptericola jiangsuensis]PFG44163.1 hypothetical protein ATJ88_2881 [Isoptericola jiangsuensis]
MLQRTCTFFYWSGAESGECPHTTTARRDDYRVACLICGATAYSPTETGAAEVEAAVETIAAWQAEHDVEVDSEPVEDLAVEVAEAEALIARGEVDVEEAATASVSGVLHGRVLLHLARIEEARPTGLTLRDAAERARVFAVVVDRVRLGAAVLNGSLIAA